MDSAKNETDDLIDNDTGQFLTEILTNQSCLHQITAEKPVQKYDTEPQTIDSLIAGGQESRYDLKSFYGIVIDTSASKFSTAGYPQFQALQHENQSLQLDTTIKGQVTVKFGIGTTSSIGSVIIKTPIGQVEFHIMEATTPFLLSLADMDKLGIYFNNLKDLLVTPRGNIPVIRRFGHCFLLWNTFLQSFIAESFNYQSYYLTTTELQRLHRRFGHPSVT